MDLSSEFKFKTSRSSKPGGQNVNKVNSRVTLVFDVNNSKVLTYCEKAVLFKKGLLTNEGFIILHSEKSRSQLKNKHDVIDRFYKLLETSLFESPPRLVSKPSPIYDLNRIASKRKNAIKKFNRNNVDDF